MSEYTYNNFNDTPDPSHRPMYLNHVLDALKLDNSIKYILDAGCGGGDFAIGLRDAGYTVFGLDLSPSGVQAAVGTGAGTFKLSSLYENLGEPFGVACFDAVVSVEVIEHLYSPRLFVRRVHESLKPDGLFIVTTPYWGYAKNIALSLTDRVDKALTALWDGGHIKHWSYRTINSLMREQGFELVMFRGCGHGIRARIPFLWNGMMVAFRRTR